MNSFCQLNAFRLTKGAGEVRPSLAVWVGPEGSEDAGFSRGGGPVSALQCPSSMSAAGVSESQTWGMFLTLQFQWQWPLWWLVLQDSKNYSWRAKLDSSSWALPTILSALNFLDGLPFYFSHSGHLPFPALYPKLYDQGITEEDQKAVCRGVCCTGKRGLWGPPHFSLCLC